MAAGLTAEFITITVPIAGHITPQTTNIMAYEIVKIRRLDIINSLQHGDQAEIARICKCGSGRVSLTLNGKVNQATETGKKIMHVSERFAHLSLMYNAMRQATIQSLLVFAIALLLFSCDNADFAGNKLHHTLWETPDNALMASIGGKCSLQLDFYEHCRGQIVSVQEQTSTCRATCIYLTQFRYTVNENCVVITTCNQKISAIVQGDSLIITDQNNVYKRIK